MSDEKKKMQEIAAELMKRFQRENESMLAEIYQDLAVFANPVEVTMYWDEEEETVKIERNK